MFADWLIVDGNNLIYAEPDWIGWRRGGDFVAARQMLIRKLDRLAGAVSRRLTIVFDGTVAGPDVAASNGNFEVLYTGAGASADGRIERMVADCPAPSSITVITDDRVERVVAEGAGATVMSCGMFVSEFRDTDREVTRQILRRPIARGPTLGDFFKDEPR